jgi:hypothetical protein
MNLDEAHRSNRMVIVDEPLHAWGKNQTHL